MQTNQIHHTSLSEDIPFYKVLQALEIKRGLHEREVIERLEIPRSTYRSWKDGTSEPSRRIYWRKLSQAFGVHLDQLIFGRDSGGTL
jgi:hypothetical protein